MCAKPLAMKTSVRRQPAKSTPPQWFYQFSACSQMYVSIEMKADRDIS